jgi:hypothetical protein
MLLDSLSNVLLRSTGLQQSVCIIVFVMRSRSTSDSMKSCFVVCLLLIYKHIIKKFGKWSQSDLRIVLCCALTSTKSRSLRSDLKVIQWRFDMLSACYTFTSTPQSTSLRNDLFKWSHEQLVCCQAHPQEVWKVKVWKVISKSSHDCSSAASLPAINNNQFFEWQFTMDTTVEQWSCAASVPAPWSVWLGDDHNHKW